MSTKRARGFTLMELMITTVVITILAGVVGAFYLEGRVSAARVETQVVLQREASLAAEVLARDLRGAGAAEQKDGALVIAASTGGEITWSVADGALVRRDANGPWILSRWGARVAVTPWDDTRGFEGTITLSRELLPGRVVSAERTILARRTVR